jgi:hypothetical protein
MLLFKIFKVHSIQLCKKNKKLSVNMSNKKCKIQFDSCRVKLILNTVREAAKFIGKNHLFTNFWSFISLSIFVQVIPGSDFPVYEFPDSNFPVSDLPSSLQLPSLRLSSLRFSSLQFSSLQFSSLNFQS